MKNLLIIIIIAFSLTATSQIKHEIKDRPPKIKNGNVLIVPDQKPVIVERREDQVIDKRKTPVIHRNNLPPGQAKKLYGKKSAHAFAPGHRKKAVLAIKH